MAEIQTPVGTTRSGKVLLVVVSEQAGLFGWCTRKFTFSLAEARTLADQLNAAADQLDPKG